MEYWKFGCLLKFMNKRLLIYLLISIVFFSLSALSGPIKQQYPLDSRPWLIGEADLHFKAQTLEQKKLMEIYKRATIDQSSPVAGTRKLLGGLGSSPPRCISKCGRCTPCRPVHVPVPPGTPVTAEYYPEAWRCKCGNRLYMP